MLPLQNLRSLHGRPLIAADGDKLGGVEEIYCDKATNEPEWFGINTGFLGTKRLVVPVEGATVDDDGIHVPYTSDVVKDAPGVDIREITEDAEAELYRHYGIHFSRAESPTILPDHDGNGAEMAAPSYAEPPNGDAALLTPGTVQPIPGAATDLGAATALDTEEPLSPELAEPIVKRRIERVAPTRRLHSARAFVRDAPVRSMLSGAAAGAIATLPMTAAMLGLQRVLPGQRNQPLPPRDITIHVSERAGLEPAGNDESGRRMLTSLAHAGYGAASGALYSGTLANTRINPVLAGAAYGAGLWTVGYAGWLPAAGLYPQVNRLSRGRNALTLAANVLWGIAAATMVRRMRTPANSYSLEP